MKNTIIPTENVMTTVGQITELLNITKDIIVPISEALVTYGCRNEKMVTEIIVKGYPFFQEVSQDFWKYINDDSFMLALIHNTNLTREEKAELTDFFLKTENQKFENITKFTKVAASGAAGIILACNSRKIIKETGKIITSISKTAIKSNNRTKAIKTICKTVEKIAKTA